MSISLYYPFFVNFLNSSFTTFPSTQVCFGKLLQLLCSSLGLRVLICPPFLQSGLASHPFLKFLKFKILFFYFYFCGGLSSPGCRNAGQWVYRCPGWGRRRSLQVTRSSPVWGSSSLPNPVLQFQSSWSSASGSSLPHPVLLFQSTSSSALVPCSLPHSLLRFHPTSSSAPVPLYLIQYSSPED